MTDAQTCLREAAETVLGRPITSLEPEMMLGDMGLDSVLLMEVVGVLERTHGISIPDEELAELSRVGEFLRVLERRF